MKRSDMEGKVTEHSRGQGTITPEMVEARARELAIIAGRSADQVNEGDRDEARRELTGADIESPMVDDAEEAVPGKAWDPVPGTTGRQVPRVPAPDEQTVNERLIGEGLEEANHDRMLEATEDAIKEAKDVEKR